jgi:hypothetical protein
MNERDIPPAEKGRTRKLRAERKELRTKELEWKKCPVQGSPVLPREFDTFPGHPAGALPRVAGGVNSTCNPGGEAVHGQSGRPV